jgi:CDP-glucose 4,6-dehydratase
MHTDFSFYKGKRVFVTGCTGFKGSWLCYVLSNIGAIVTGYALDPPTDPSLFSIASVDNCLNFINGDIRDYNNLEKAYMNAEPEIVFHLAAQPIVRESYINPRYTYETNVIGTVNILECLRIYSKTRSFLNITTDKVYKNNEWSWGYRENEELDGFDPYSNSKSCSELVTNTYRRSFFAKSSATTLTAISTARAGNVIGGGDFQKDRIIPDCIRAVLKKESIVIRNPYSIRPYQHVLEPIFAYLLIAKSQYLNEALAGAYNVGPEEADCAQTGVLVDLFVKEWGSKAQWINKQDNGPHEASFLKLDCSKIKSALGWHPRTNIRDAIELLVDWYKCWQYGEDVRNCMDKQIMLFMNKNDGRSLADSKRSIA